MAEVSAMVSFLVFYMIYILVFVGGGLASYILFGLGLYEMAQRQGLSNPWLAFVPIARHYMQGKVAGPIKLKKREIKDPGIWMILVPIAFGVLLFAVYIMVFLVAFIGGITSASISFRSGSAVLGILFVACFMAVIAVACMAVKKGLTGLVDYQIYQRYETGNTVLLHMLLSLFIPLYQSIYFFWLRKKAYREGVPVPPPAPHGYQGPGPQAGHPQGQMPEEMREPDPMADDRQEQENTTKTE